MKIVAEMAIFRLLSHLNSAQDKESKRWAYIRGGGGGL